MGNLYRFVEPVVLYLLTRDGPSHGYELASGLRQQAVTDAVVERAALYRALKQLEQQNYVQSQWDTSHAGPARHVYAITDSGERHLADWVAVLDRLAKSMQGFVNEAQGSDTEQAAQARRGRV
jgi:poly-beta-hydroxybutyrate-responsive repressor